IALYAALFLGGVQELKPIAGKPAADSIAASAGVRDGDVIRSVDGEAVRSWQDVRWLLLDQVIDHESATLEVLTADQTIENRSLDLSAVTTDQSQGDLLSQIGLRPHRPQIDAGVGQIAAGSPAEAVGLQPGDRIVAIDGEQVEHWEMLVERVRAAPEMLTLTVERGETRMQIEATPEVVGAGEARHGRLGIGPQID